MRTETIAIYEYSELSEESQARARDWYRNMSDFQEIFDDVRDTLTSAKKKLGFRVIDYQWGLDGIRKLSVFVPNKFDTLADFIEPALLTGDCPFTGCYLDEDFLDPFRKAPMTEVDIHGVVYAAVQSLFYAGICALESAWSDESVAESLIVNEYEFTAEGRHYL